MWTILSHWLDTVIVMDVVCPVRAGSGHEELRYALRSWAAHLPHARVWLVGHRPHWASDQVGHIPTVQGGDPWVNTSVAMVAACAHPEVSGSFIWCDDDNFVMHPVAGLTLAHRGPLVEHAASRASPSAGVDAYARQLVDAAALLDSLDVPALSYELHRPMVVDKAGMRAALVLSPGLGAAKRSVYGNLSGEVGEQVSDVKVNWRTPRGYNHDTVFLSTAPDAFAHGHVGTFIRGRFPERCRYEKGGPS